MRVGVLEINKYCYAAAKSRVYGIGECIKILKN